MINNLLKKLGHQKQRGESQENRREDERGQLRNQKEYRKKKDTTEGQGDKKGTIELNKKVPRNATCKESQRMKK